MAVKDDDWQPGDNSTALKAIMTFCWECLGGETPVEECAALECPLYPYRTGKPTKAALRDSRRARRLGDRLQAGDKKTADADDQEALFHPLEGQDGLFD